MESSSNVIAIVTFAPAIVIGFLMTFYRNNILCFWNCNPTGIQIKQYSLMVRNTVLELVANITSSKEVMQRILHSTILTIATSIHEMLVTVYQTFHNILLDIASRLSNTIETVRNYSYALVESWSPKATDYAFPIEVIFMIGMYTLVSVSIYYLIKNKMEESDEPKRVHFEPVSAEEQQQHPVESVDFPPALDSMKEEKKTPVRRRTRRT